VSKATFVVRDQELAELRHNLRTPVNHILGYGEMLVEDAEDAGDEALVSSLRSVQDDGRQLLTLINGTLTPSQGEVRSEDLRRLHRELMNPLNRIVSTTRKFENGTGPAGPLLNDIRKIRTAAERLAAMAEEMIVSPGGKRPPSVEVPAVKSNGNANATTETTVAAKPVEQVAPGSKGHLLVVDDIESNRDVLGRRLEREGYQVSFAANGQMALDLIREQPFDLVLLDIMMPELDGFQVLSRMKADTVLRDIPVIMISALDEIQSVVRCLETGADDYLSKPFDPVLLRARIGASLERKRLRDEQRRKTAELEIAIEDARKERELSISLLRNILPTQVADELQGKGAVDPKYFEDVTILFTDFAGFTLATENLAAEDLVNVLHKYFTAFDSVITKYGLEKLKTIGDAYMLAGGLPVRSPSHPVDVVLAALELVDVVEQFHTEETPWRIRVGVHTGPVIAGVVGIKKFAFDIWGETVNVASRMESCGTPNRINLSSRTYSRVKDFFQCESRGRIATKEGKELDMYFVKGILPKLMEDSSQCPPPAFLRRYRIYFQKDPPSFPAFLLEPGTKACSAAATTATPR
jgi:class 3 adenylate cyclase